GALLHVVSDEIRMQRFGSRWERAADLGACAVGLLVAGTGALLHLQEAAPVAGFLRALAGIALASAPALLIGAVITALLAARGVRPLSLEAVFLAFALMGPGAALFLALLELALSLLL